MYVLIAKLHSPGSLTPILLLLQAEASSAHAAVDEAEARHALQRRIDEALLERDSSFVAAEERLRELRETSVLLGEVQAEAAALRRELAEARRGGGGSGGGGGGGNGGGGGDGGGGTDEASRLAESRRVGTAHAAAAIATTIATPAISSTLAAAASSAATLDAAALATPALFTPAFATPATSSTHATAAAGSRDATDATDAALGQAAVGAAAAQRTTAAADELVAVVAELERVREEVVAERAVRGALEARLGEEVAAHATCCEALGAATRRLESGGADSATDVAVQAHGAAARAHDESAAQVARRECEAGLLAGELRVYEDGWVSAAQLAGASSSAARTTEAVEVPALRVRVGELEAELAQLRASGGEKPAAVVMA